MVVIVVLANAIKHPVSYQHGVCNWTPLCYAFINVVSIKE